MTNFLKVVGSWLPLVALFIPLVVGLVTKLNASSKVKSLAMIFITGVSSLAYQVDAGGGILTRQTAGAWAMSIVIATATYLGVWKPLEVTQKLLPNNGLG